MNVSFAAAVCLALSIVAYADPGHAGSRRDRAGSIVSAGSDIRITSIGEVIAPPVAIIKVDQPRPRHDRDRTLSRPGTFASKP